MCVLLEEVGGVHQNVVTVFGRYRETPERRLGKCLLGGLPFIRIARDSAKGIVGLNQQHLRPHALKLDHTRFARLPAVKANVIRAHALRKGFDVKKFGVPLADLKPELALVVVPVEVEVAGQLLEAVCLLRNARQRLGLGRWRLVLQSSAAGHCHRQGRSTRVHTPPTRASDAE